MIVDPEGHQIGKNSSLMAQAPKVSRPHIGKHGLAEEVKDGRYVTVRITLDDGTVLDGSECWWVQIDANGKPI